jgi:hypothetical protein
VATILCVLYDDPTDEQPTSYAREGVPTIERYPGGQTTPTPDAIDFTPRELLGDVTGALSQASLPATRAMCGTPSPRRPDHPWRTMRHHGMTPHTSGTSLSAQARYAAGTREILECFLGDRPIRDEYLIVDRGALAGTGAHSYSAGSAGRRASQEEDAEPAA